MRWSVHEQIAWSAVCRLSYQHLVNKTGSIVVKNVSEPFVSAATDAEAKIIRGGRGAGLNIISSAGYSGKHHTVDSVDGVEDTLFDRVQVSAP